MGGAVAIGGIAEIEAVIAEPAGDRLDLAGQSAERCFQTWRSVSGLLNPPGHQSRVNH